MKTVLIQYADLSCENNAHTSETKTVIGKFVQIRHTGTEYLIFSPRGLTKYHADIVRRFCRDRGIEGVYNEQLKRFVIHDLSWDVLGGGKFEMDHEKRILRLYDNSMAYGRFDASGLEEKILSLKEISKYRVVIE